MVGNRILTGPMSCMNSTQILNQPKPAAHGCRCPPTELVMVGDRYLTDVVFGNRLGMLTIRTAPLTFRGEPRAVLLVRASS